MSNQRSCIVSFSLGPRQGDGDSEIAMVVEDEDLIETTMNGERYMASRFAATLRRQLYKGAPLRSPVRAR